LEFTLVLEEELLSEHRVEASEEKEEELLLRWVVGRDLGEVEG
jgi:hypothetical protein